MRLVAGQFSTTTELRLEGKKSPGNWNQKKFTMFERHQKEENFTEELKHFLLLIHLKNNEKLLLKILSNFLTRQVTKMISNFKDVKSIDSN
jgi:hypothetical protein